MLRKLVHLSYLLIYATRVCQTKYVEGEIHTSENWAFLARFCFLSEEGQYEYYFEYNDEQGEPNILLYYDTEDQWPAVYKSNKTCFGRESVLKFDQIINLTTRYAFREWSGCVTNPAHNTPRPKYSVQIPTLATRKKPTTTKPMSTTGSDSSSYSTSSMMTTEMYTTDSIISSTDNNAGTTSPTEDFSTTIYETTNYRMEEGTYMTGLTEGLTMVQNNVETTEETTQTDTVRKFKRSLPRGKSGRAVVCRNARRFRSARERWWFIAVSNCNGSKGIHIKYKILMTNGPSGDYWHEHFSADEFYVLPVLMAFSIAYAFLILAIVICSIELKSRQLLHSTYKLFVVSVMIQFMGIIFKCMSYLKYAVNGLGSPNLKLVGALFMGTSETCFLLQLLLLAKGYTVTRGRLPLSAGVKLTIFMCLYVVTYISLFIYEAKVFDPGEVLYTYESPAGYGLIVLRILAWCMFIYSTVFTLKHYPEKANFYYPFNVFGTLWFIAGPAFIISANTYIDKWVRESVVCAVLLFITFGGHLMFLLLTMPSVANKNFPYHVRTTQIGVMEVTGVSGNNSIEQFGHHTYEPSTTTNIEQTIIVPLSRRTEEIFGGLYSQQMHTTIRRTSGGIEEVERRPSRQGNDMIMENVLSWSLAKNFGALDVAQFDRVINGNIEPDRSDGLEDRGRVPALENASTPPLQDSNLSDWVREVPVELFTISKMVVTKQPAAVNRRQEDSD